MWCLDSNASFLRLLHILKDTTGDHVRWSICNSVVAIVYSDGSFHSVEMMITPTHNEVWRGLKVEQVAEL